MQLEFKFLLNHPMKITCFSSTGHHPGIVNSQKYLCNPSSDVEIKWLHRNFDEAHFWCVWDNLNFYWFNGQFMTVAKDHFIFWTLFQLLDSKLTQIVRLGFLLLFATKLVVAQISSIFSHFKQGYHWVQGTITYPKIL